MIEEPTIAEQIAAYARSRLDSDDITVLRLIAAGRSKPQMAEFLHMSVSTVDKRILRVRTVLGAEDRAHAVGIAYATGLLKGMP